MLISQSRLNPPRFDFDTPGATKKTNADRRSRRLVPLERESFLGESLQEILFTIVGLGSGILFEKA